MMNNPNFTWFLRYQFYSMMFFDLDQSTMYFKRMTVSEENFKDPYSLRHFLGLLAVLLIPTLPATLTLIKVLS